MAKSTVVKKRKNKKNFNDHRSNHFSSLKYYKFGETKY